MKHCTGYLAALAFGLAALPIAAMAEGTPQHDPREIAPDGLIGYWKADIGASTYGSAKPSAAYRSFAYTEGGKVLVSFMTRNADGKVSFGHWAAQVDGTPAIEYHSSGGSLPWNVVSWQPGQQGTLALTVSRQGKPSIKAIYALSTDGQTLTYSYDKTKIIYRRWTLAE